MNINFWFLQARKLLLDPAIHAEFTRMKVMKNVHKFG